MAYALVVEDYYSGSIAKCLARCISSYWSGAEWISNKNKKKTKKHTNKLKWKYNIRNQKNVCGMHWVQCSKFNSEFLKISYKKIHRGEWGQSGWSPPMVKEKDIKKKEKSTIGELLNQGCYLSVRCWPGIAHFFWASLPPQVGAFLGLIYLLGTQPTQLFLRLNLSYLFCCYDVMLLFVCVCVNTLY